MGNKRVSIADKVQQGMGADVFFKQDSEFVTDKNSEDDNIKESAQSNTEGTIKDTTQSSIKDTTQGTTQYTIQMPDRTETYEERLVFNVSKRQKKYVKDMAKRKGVSESEFARFMIDSFIKNIKIE